MAPEVIKNSGSGHQWAVDFWSFGVLLYELLTGASPFTVEGQKNTASEVSRRILNKSPPTPQGVSSVAIDLIMKLLEKDPKKRLGSEKGGFLKIKSHPFWHDIDWAKLAKKSIPAPFKPIINSDVDTSNFAEEFTRMQAAYSPATTPAHNLPFKGYSFVSPSVMFGRPHALTDDLLTHSTRSSSHSPLPLYLQEDQKSPQENFFHLFELDLNGEPLGDGSFSICRRCTRISTQEDFAVKIVSRKWQSCLQNELKTLSLCQGHPNIVQLIGVYHDQHHTFIVMEELKGGELLNMIRCRERLTEAEAGLIMSQIASAVSYMHSKRVVHRDLKPENILFVEATSPTGFPLHVKIVDFGFARFRPVPTTGPHVPLKTPVFTLHYAAPEVLDQTSFNLTTSSATESSEGGYDEACDLWSMGVILVSDVIDIEL